MRKNRWWRIGVNEGARLMTSDEKIDKVIGMIDVIATEVAKNGASIEQMHGSLGQIRISLDETQATLGAFVVETRTGFARVERRLGNIETRVESLEEHAVRVDSRLASLETGSTLVDTRLSSIETHVAHIDSTLLKLL